ncbi:MAG: hypothetical protein RKE49_15245 [Oceanicaulis sp.]
MNRLIVSAAAIGALFTVSACTSAPKVSPRQPGDANLSCSELENEFVNLDQVAEEAESNQGVNTANVAAVVFFWPAAVGNYMDSERALELVDERRDHLMDLYEAKNCDGM